MSAVTTLTPEQLKLRKTGMGGTDIGPVCGEGGFAEVIEIWCDKVAPDDAPAPKRELTRAMLRGIRFEPFLKDWYCDEAGIDPGVVAHPGTIRHPDAARYPLCLASPDGVLGDTLLEIKSPGAGTAHSWGEEGTDQIPEYYIPQVHWTMAATGCSQAQVVAYVRDDMRVYHVPFREDLFQLMYHQGREFWERYVFTKTPPPIDGTDAYCDYIQARYPKSVGTMRYDNDPRTVELLTKYVAIKEEAARVKATESQLYNSIIALIGHDDGIEGDWGKATYKSTKDREHVDNAGLIQALKQHGVGELVARFTETRPGYRVLRPTLRGAK